MKILYIDLDDTVADFLRSARDKDGNIDVPMMYDEGFFLSLKPVAGALVAIRRLSEKFDVWFLSQPVYNSAHSYSEKAQWVGKWFPELAQKLILTQDKGLHVGDYLIDDNEEKWKEKFEANGGKFIHFKYSRDDNDLNRANWEWIVNYLEHLEIKSRNP